MTTASSSATRSTRSVCEVCTTSATMSARGTPYRAMMDTARMRKARISRLRIPKALVEPEPHPAQRGDPHVRAGLLELLPQPGDGDIQCLRGAEPVLVPDFVHQPFPRDHRAAAQVQLRQQIELLGAQRQLASTDECATGVDIDHQSAFGREG